jgi:hypothetical protein
MGGSDKCWLIRSVTGTDSVVPLTVFSVVLKVGTESRGLENSGWKDAHSSWQRGDLRSCLSIVGGQSASCVGSAW